MTIGRPKPLTDPLYEEIELHSEITGRDYQLRIGLPNTYHAGKGRYPVFLVLDADISFGTACDTAQLEAMWSEAPLKHRDYRGVPEMIVVGVALPDRAANPFRRNYEYMVAETAPEPPTTALGQYLAELAQRFPDDGPKFGGAPQFLETIIREILPAIDAHYRTDTGRRILSGQSAGGHFCCYTLLTRPETFTDYIIVSPGLPGEAIFQLEAAWAAGHDDLKANVFLTAGGNEVIDPFEIVSRTARLAETLHFRRYPNLNLKTWFIPDASHIQTAAPSMARGLVTLLGQPADEAKSRP